MSAAGATSGMQLYRPWGETHYTSGSLLTQYQYTGQWKSASGLYWYNSRWYDSALGRFVQPDTLIPEASQGTQAWDRYAYVNNNALRYTDPSGHQMAGDTNENGCSGASSGPACIMDMYGGYGDTDGMDASLRGYARNHPDYNSLNDPGLDDTGRSLYANAAFQAAAEDAADGNISLWNALSKGMAGALAAIIVGGGTGWGDAGGDSAVIEGGPYYRGGAYKAGPNDLRIDPDTGLIRPGRGISVNTDPGKVAKFGSVSRVESLPDGLALFKTGRDPGHFEIAAINPMTPENFDNLLQQILYTIFQ